MKVHTMWLKLTHLDGSPVFVNLANVDSIHSSYKNERGTEIVHNGPGYEFNDEYVHNVTCVRETIMEIENMLRMQGLVV